MILNYSETISAEEQKNIKLRPVAISANQMLEI
jgi:hypothetical protein